MTTNEFNEKWKDYLEPKFYGLRIQNPEVVDFLDQVFMDITKIPNFKYTQIKMKFGQCRFYSSLRRALTFLIEQEINKIVNN
jgi:hypothetical protein